CYHRTFTNWRLAMSANEEILELHDRLNNERRRRATEEAEATRSAHEARSLRAEVARLQGELEQLQPPPPPATPPPPREPAVPSPTAPQRPPGGFGGTLPVPSPPGRPAGRF